MSQAPTPNSPGRNFELVQEMYSAFDMRDIDALLSVIGTDVEWAKLEIRTTQRVAPDVAIRFHGMGSDRHPIGRVSGPRAS